MFVCYFLMTLVLVTGGSGLLGHGIENVLSEEDLKNFSWIFLSSNDCDLKYVAKYHLSILLITLL